MSETVEAYPLCWPSNKKRTGNYSREHARFNTSFARARDEIVRQVELLNGRYLRSNLIISTNLALRRDGLPLASQKQPDDPGIAIYFTYKNQQMCFACDRWIKIEHNMQAIAKTIEALRGIARWGTGDMMEAAFTGFAALPSPPSSKNWRNILGMPELGRFYLKNDVLLIAEKKYKELRSLHHPDKGGNAEMFHAVQLAWEEAKKELTGE